MQKLSMDEILGPVSTDSKKSDDSRDELGVVSRELIDAVHAKDTDAVKDCLRAAFQCMELEPDEEDSHESQE